MRNYAWLILSMGLSLSLMGCGEDENGGGGGTGTVTLSGIVYAAALEGESTPLQGATVSDGTSTTTSGDGGAFSLQSQVGPGTLLTTATGHWGELLVGDVPVGGVSDLEPEVVPDALIAQVSGALGESVDSEKGIVGVEFDMPVGGETADLGATYGFAFVFNADDEPELGTELIADGGSEVIFVNVDVSADVMPTASDAGSAACSPEFPTSAYPSQAKVITSVFMNCP